MSLIAVVVILLLVGFGLYALQRWGTMIDPGIKKIIYVVVIIVVVLWLLSLFGPWPDLYVGRK